jgi:hypothetical protein
MISMSSFAKDTCQRMNTEESYWQMDSASLVTSTKPFLLPINDFSLLSLQLQSIMFASSLTLPLKSSTKMMSPSMLKNPSSLLPIVFQRPLERRERRFSMVLLFPLVLRAKRKRIKRHPHLFLSLPSPLIPFPLPPHLTLIANLTILSMMTLSWKTPLFPSHLKPPRPPITLSRSLDHLSLRHHSPSPPTPSLSLIAF